PLAGALHLPYARGRDGRPSVSAATATDPLRVCARGLGKRYKIYPRARDRLVEWLGRGRWTRHREEWALREVSFALAARESLGIIGMNGAGKSTLLKILSGTTLPTEGDFEVHGRV